VSLRAEPVGRGEGLAWIIGAAGAIGFAVAAYADRATAFQSYLFVWWFLLGIPLGSIAMLAVHDMTGGGWGEVVRGPLDAAARLLPLSLLLVVPLLFGLADLYPWARPDAVAADPLLQDKRWYLSVDFFLLRNAVYFVIWLVLGHLLRKWAFARHAGATQHDRERLRAIAAIGLLLYAATVTFAGVDWVMSLSPRWFSTTFGFLVGIGQTMCAFCFAIVCAAWRLRDAVGSQANLPSTGPESDRLEGDVPGLFQDLGNLLLMFVMTWAYLAFTQYLITWAEDLPNEIAWYLPRVTTSWHDVALLLVAIHFALPFLVLLSRRAKRVPRALGALAALLLMAHVVDAYWLVVPAHRPSGISVAWSDVAAIAALGGIWLAVFLRNAGGAPAAAAVSHGAARHG
jgi:hypothetical protein